MCRFERGTAEIRRMEGRCKTDQRITVTGTALRVPHGDTAAVGRTDPVSEIQQINRTGHLQQRLVECAFTR